MRLGSRSFRGICGGSWGWWLGNITGMTVYATDVDAALANFDLLGMRFGPIGAAPPMTLVGVSRLAIPPLMIEITVTAAD
jgi:enamine deaminase RidA (YjgF/YER057c/UK114 family)